MSATIERWYPPNDPSAFESLCLELWRDIWQDPDAQKNGRRGQPQAGVDIFGQHVGNWVGVQCKQKDGLLRARLTTKELEAEVEAAKNFKPPLSSFTLATTGPRDDKVQERARQLTQDHKRDGLFDVHVWSWDDIWEGLYRRDDLLRRIASTYWPRLASLRESGHWSVPFPRNPYFTGRKDVLSRLHEGFSTDGLRQPLQALTGLGGLGKTQTAVEYLYEHAGEYNSVLWVTGASREQAQGDLIAIAGLLNLPDRDSPDPLVVIRSVVHWLESNDRWFLVVDNVDDSPAVVDFLPTKPRGHVLITSRWDNLDAVGIPRPLRLDALSPSDAVSFLFARTTGDADDSAERTAAEELSLMLGYLPLALEQAGAYVKETSCSITDYVASFRRRSDQLLRVSVPATGRYEATVHSTWSINFDEVERASPGSADILRIVAFLAPDVIPEQLLIEGRNECGPHVAAALAGADEDKLLVLDLLRPLIRYSLVVRDPASRAITIHRLVQAVMRSRMTAEEQRMWATRAARAVNKAFPEASYDVWPLCDALLPHAKVAATIANDFAMTYEDVGFLLNEAAAFMRLRGDFEGSQNLHKQSLALRERELPADHPQLAESLNDVACLYLDLYEYESARPLFERALAISRARLPEGQQDHLLYLANLGLLYARLGWCQESEGLLLEAEHLARELGASQLYVYAGVLNSLAEVHLRQGRLEEAEEESRKSLELRRTIGNPEKLGRTLVTLGEINKRQRAYAAAEELFLEALRLKSTVFGEDHAELIPALTRYAKLLTELGRSHEANDAEARAERIRARFRLPKYDDSNCR